MRVEIGNVVQLRDGRVVLVTDATPQELNVWEAEGGAVREENILIGITYDMRSLGWSKDSYTVVTDMSEVVSIIAEQVV